MHNSRIIISVNPKIMINSLGVHFDITRQCAKVELKNINVFNKTNHLRRSARNRKTFLENDFHHNFVQFLA
jgi:hypothetical protein